MAPAPESLDPELLLEEDGFVRGLARHLLRDPHGAEDLAQQTWVAALERPAPPAPALRNWLAAVVRRLAIRRARGEARERARLERSARPSEVPSAATIVAREAIRAELVRAVLALEKPYRDAVLLRYFENLPPRAVARRLGIPVETARTHLKRAMSQLRARLDARTDGGRSAWCALLLPFAKAPAVPLLATAASLPAVLSGALLMTTKTTILSVLGLVAALALAITLWNTNRTDTSRDAAPQTPAVAKSDPNDRAPRRETQAEGPALAESARSEASLSRPAESAPGAAKTGSLLVHAIYQDDKTPAAGVVLQISRGDNEPLASSPHATTDAKGNATFPELDPGRIWIQIRRGETEWGKDQRIVAGQRLELTVEVPTGMNAKGIVTDARGKPIAGADVLVAGWAGGESVPLTQTASDGTFSLRALSTHCHIGAAAAGYGPSPMRRFTTAKGANVEFTIVLPDAGCTLTGAVLGPNGRPVAGALVRAGWNEQRPTNLPDGGEAMGPQCQLILTDAAGRFSFASVEAGSLPLGVRARGLAPWSQTIELGSARQKEVTVELLEGVTLLGSVRDASGNGVARAEVRVGDWTDIGHMRMRSDANGEFRFDGLAPGELSLHIETEKSGKAEAKLRGVAGETVRWDAVLSKGLELRGRVVDADGKPVAHAMVEVNIGWFAFDNTDEQGRFSLKDAPAGKSFELSVRRKSTFPEIVVPVKTIGTEELLIRLPKEAWIYIRGTILDPDGHPLPNVGVSPYMKKGGGSPAETADAKTGEFKYGPYPPGEYSIRFHADGFPDIQLPFRAVAPDETWDLGTLRFSRGGTLAVTLAGARAAANPNIPAAILDAAGEQVETIQVKNGAGRSKPMIPGKYQLQVRGPGIACALVPFEIASEAETRLDVPLEAGVATTVEVALPPGLELRERIRVTIEERGGAAVLRSFEWPRGDVATLSLGLRPGEYRVSAKMGGASGEAQLSVGAAGPAAAKLELK